MLDAALTAVLGPGRHVTLTADLGPAPRYRSFLAVARGHVRVVAGTRAAAFAPVHDLGLVAQWDDGDDLYAEPRAPYPHTREVLLLRAHDVGAGVLLAGRSRSVEAGALVASGWAREVVADRAEVRRQAPRVSVTGDRDVELERDPTPAPPAPERRPRRDPRGPDGGSGAGADPAAGLRRGAGLPYLPHPGALRPLPGAAGRRRSGGAADVPVVRAGRGWDAPAGSAATGGARPGRGRPPHRRGARAGLPARAGAPLQRRARPRADVGPEPAIVVATPGAEPPAEDGYAAVVLLDTWLLLARPDLRTGEEAAAALVQRRGARPAGRAGRPRRRGGRPGRAGPAGPGALGPGRLRRPRGRRSGRRPTCRRPRGWRSSRASREPSTTCWRACGLPAGCRGARARCPVARRTGPPGPRPTHAGGARAAGPGGGRACPGRPARRCRGGCWRCRACAPRASCRPVRVAGRPLVAGLSASRLAVDCAPLPTREAPVTVQPIRLFGDPVLRTPATPVVDFDAELRRLVKDLTDTMLAAPGAGLAAPQIGVGLRVFTWNVDGEVGHLVNPDLTLSEETQHGEEGCLSIPDLAFDCTPALSVVARGFDDVRRAGHDPGLGPAGPRDPARDRPPRRGAVRERLDAETRKAAMRAIRESDWFGAPPTIKLSPHPHAPVWGCEA